ncbi:M23 family metallopeptidase [Streptomyces sp. SYSU K21746]
MRRLWALVAMVAVSLLTLGSAPAYATTEEATAARPDFRLPFACGQVWQLQTYAGHNPEDKKLDMYRVGGPTLGGQVVASAPGRVHEFFEPGGLEIDHGNGWFTVYLHMDRRDVVLGQQVQAGAPLGRLGLVGTSTAHLHYEQLFDSNGDHDGETDEMVHPVIQGTEYRLSPSGPFPRVTSTNACGGGTPAPQKYWVDTFADATGYASPHCVGKNTPECAPQGTLRAGTNYVFCKVKGDRVGDGSSFNHYWLRTDLDVVNPGGSGRAYVSAYYLQRWGNDEAKDNSGTVIRDCGPGE